MSKATTITIDLVNCTQLKGSDTLGNGCPHCGSKLTKGYGYATDYFCTLMNNRITSAYVESHRDLIPIPNWCPKRVDKAEIDKLEQEKIIGLDI